MEGIGGGRDWSGGRGGDGGGGGGGDGRDWGGDGGGSGRDWGGDRGWGWKGLGRRLGERREVEWEWDTLPLKFEVSDTSVFMHALCHLLD